MKKTLMVLLLIAVGILLWSNIFDRSDQSYALYEGKTAAQWAGEAAAQRGYAIGLEKELNKIKTGCSDIWRVPRLPEPSTHDI